MFWQNGVLKSGHEMKNSHQPIEFVRNPLFPKIEQPKAFEIIFSKKKAEPIIRVLRGNAILDCY